jgi:lipoprotein signal peptidase
MKTDNSKKLKIKELISVLTIVIGILSMLMKIYEDSEPGAIPLLLILLGAGGYLITRGQIRKQHLSSQ